MTAQTTPVEAHQVPTSIWRLVSGVGLVILADFLFFGHQVDIAAAIFATALLVLTITFYPRLLATRQVVLAAAFAGAGIVALAESLNPGSIVFGIAGLATLAIGARSTWNYDPLGWLAEIAGFFAQGLSNIISDWASIGGTHQRATPEDTGLPSLGAWFLIVVLSMIFVFLFAIANPILNTWLSTIDWRTTFELLHPNRLVFWCAALLSCWPFLTPRRIKSASELQADWHETLDQETNRAATDPAPAPVPPAEFSSASAMAALVVFNAIFALQTTLDGIYLWGGLTLPDGAHYAQFAHRSAYPLIVTALLAAAIILVVMQRGSPGEKSPVIRALVYLWIAQNVLLVASCIFRTELYVSVYHLTYWRVAAFIWMALVAAGLILIVVRIALNLTNVWLLKANVVLLTATLYVCSVTDIGRHIAWHNVRHALEITGEGTTLDVAYMHRYVGAAALPALDWFRQQPRVKAEHPDKILRIENSMGPLAEHFQWRMRSWRGYTFRNARLLHEMKDATLDGTALFPPHGSWRVEGR